MTVSEEHLEAITTDVWSTMLDSELVNNGAPAPAAGGNAPEEVPGPGAEVTIAGAWEGRVRIETSAGLARQATAALFGMEEDEVDDELIADAIGELANIIGGNVKALLPAPTHLSLPQPLGGGAADVVAEVYLSCGDQPVSVIVERLPSAGETSPAGE